MLAPFAPHLCEELWSAMGEPGSVCLAKFPEFEAAYLVESSFEYPVSINGKMRFKQEFPLDKPIKDIEQEIAQNPQTLKYIEGSAIKKTIVVKGKIINIVI